MKFNKQLLFVLLGPLAFAIMEAFGPPESMPIEAWHVLATTAWVAIWWITEALPLAVTSLLPIILFPLTDALSLEQTTAAYGHKLIFLYVGGFILAIAIEKWMLHKRIALAIINMVGTNMVYMVLGFMIATAFLSMWISNTATAVMMLPIGMAVVSQIPAGKDQALIGKALMLSIAYSASIGGMATLIGTPPNLIFAGMVHDIYGIDISFFQWFKFGLPISFILLFICWQYLTKIAFHLRGREFPGGRAEINRMRKELGGMSKQEFRVMVVFIITALAWVTRSFFLDSLLPGINDTIIALIAVFALFILPSGKKKKPLITWEEAVKLPWGILLLFGGGMALAAGFQDTGLAVWIGNQLTLLNGLSIFLIIVILVASVNFLTELTSNLATTSMLLPILAPMALAFGIHPFTLMVAATTAASCAFMLPAATPPNAVVFGSNYLRITDMVRSGFRMNLISIIIIALFVYWVLPFLWNLNPNTFPTSILNN